MMMDEDRDLEPLRALLRRTSAETPDLWPRLRRRLAAEEVSARLELHLPRFTWAAAAAATIAVAIPALAPNPSYLLAVMFGAS